MSSEATGFVVDAEKGYIMTNRHVVGAGPFWGYCIFDNHEEVRAEYLPKNSKIQTNSGSAMCSPYIETPFTTLVYSVLTQKRSSI